MRLGFCVLALVVGHALAFSSRTSDPCSTAVDPVQCHYQVGVALLAKLGTDPSGPLVANHLQLQPAAAPVSLLSKASSQVTQAFTQVSQAFDQLSNASSQVDDHQTQQAVQQPPMASSPLPASVASTPMSEQAMQDKEVAALQGALEALEAPGPTTPALDEDIDELEDSLESLRPGALSAFRVQRLADAINRAGPPAAAEQRAAQAFHFLDAAQWAAGSQVPSITAHLRRVGASKPHADKTSLLQTLEDTVSGWTRACAE